MMGKGARASQEAALTGEKGVLLGDDNRRIVVILKMLLEEVRYRYIAWRAQGRRLKRKRLDLN